MHRLLVNHAKIFSSPDVISSSSRKMIFFPKLASTCNCSKFTAYKMILVLASVESCMDADVNSHAKYARLYHMKVPIIENVKELIRLQFLLRYYEQQLYFHSTLKANTRYIVTVSSNFSMIRPFFPQMVDSVDQKFQNVHQVLARTEFLY